MADTDVTPGQKQALAGKYTLKAVWNQIVSDFNAPRQFVKHLPGDVVKLTEEEAERFLRHGLATPVDDEAKATPAAKAPSTVDKAVAINAQVGQRPIADTEKQQVIPNPVPAAGVSPVPPLT